MQVLRNRADFKAAARGLRVRRRGFTLQARQRDDDGEARFGFTVTRKVGNAVVRNRIRRRLREVVRKVEDRAGTSTDYVLIGRRAALTLSFSSLVDDLRAGLEEISKSARWDAR